MKSHDDEDRRQGRCSDTFRAWLLRPLLRYVDQRFDLVDAAIAKFQPPKPPRAVRITLALPSITREGKPMPNFELASDEVATITILARDASGDIVPAPAGDTFSVTSSNPASLAAAVGVDANGNPAIVLTPMVKASPNITVSVSDSAGLAVDEQIVDVVEDASPRAIGLDTANAALASQPEPVNPGP